MDRRMVDRDAAFGHHLFQIPQAQIVSQIPPHAEQDHGSIKMPALEHRCPPPLRPPAPVAETLKQKVCDRAFDDGVDDRCAIATGIGTAEEIVFPAQGQRPDCPLSGIVAHLKPPVSGVNRESLPAGGHIADRLGQFAFAADARERRRCRAGRTSTPWRSRRWSMASLARGSFRGTAPPSRTG